MKIFWQRAVKVIKEKIANFDYFELGNSFLLYYLLIFGSLPLALFFGIPSKYVEYFLTQGVPAFNGLVFVYLLVGIIFFILGYKFFNFKILTEKTSAIFKKEWNFKRTFFVFAAVFITGIFIKGIRIFEGGYSRLNISQSFVNSPFYSLIGLLDWLGPTALAIAFVYYFYLLKNNDFRYKIWRAIAWLAFAVEFFYGFFSLSRFSAIIPILVYLITKHYVYNRSYKRVIIAGLLIFIVLMPVLNFYRNPASFYSYAVGGKIEIKNIEQFIIDSSVGRVNQSKIIFNVFEKTDKFLHGKNLLNFFVSLGPPRFIWKNKPVINAFGNDFGRKYGILNPDDFQTSVAPTMVGDLYINFGLMGIAFGMLTFGMLYRIFFDSLIRKSAISLSGVVIYSISWIQIIRGTEDWIPPVWAGLVKLLVIMAVIHYFLTTSKS